jgi:hypothetical protein
MLLPVPNKDVPATLYRFAERVSGIVRLFDVAD